MSFCWSEDMTSVPFFFWKRFLTFMQERCQLFRPLLHELSRHSSAVPNKCYSRAWFWYMPASVWTSCWKGILCGVINRVDSVIAMTETHPFEGETQYSDIIATYSDTHWQTSKEFVRKCFGPHPVVIILVDMLYAYNLFLCVCEFSSSSLL